MKTPIPAAVFALVTALFSSLLLGSTDFPPTEKRAASDEFHGIKVTEDYRWLEEAEDPAVKAWTEAQNRYTRAYLDSLPDRKEIAATLKGWYDAVTPSYSYVIPWPGRLFALKFQPPKQQELLVTLASPEDKGSEKVVLDPNELEPKGQVAMDWYVPSRDGETVAICLSENGSEDGTLHFYKTATGERLADRIPRVQYPTGGGSAAWSADGKT
ncbi:MAG TPA: hypothetical protein VD994_17690, partial [Prosthecobacter sp.]|nr:hypothetical protein [Prosthecobacter sp.]